MVKKQRLQESELTPERARELLAYNPQTGLFTWNKRPSHNSRVAIGDVAGVRSDRYTRIGIGGRLFQAHRLAWLHTHGTWPANQIDHINGVKHDNRIDNLREIDSFGNCQNTKATIRNKCGVKGVCFVTGKWRAMIHHKKQNIYLGLFDRIEDAAAAYAAGAGKYHTHNPAAQPAAQSA